jgi:type I restriction enzyme S subunit
VTAPDRTTLGALVKGGGSIKTGPFGTTLKAAEYSDSGVPVISVGEVGHGRLRVRDSTPRVGPDVVRRLPEYVLRAADIVFGRKGAVDRAARVRESEDGYFLGSDGIRVRFAAGVDPRYIIHELQSAETRSWLIQNANGTTMASLNQEVLRRVPIRVLPLAEQHAVGQILDDVDTLISSIERSIAKKQAIKQGIMQQLLTGKSRLPGFTTEWGQTRLGDHFEITSSKRVFQREWRSSGVPFYRARELAVLSETGKVDNDLFIDHELFHKYKRLHGAPSAGDFLVTAVGTLGKTYVVQPKDEFYFKDGNNIWLKASATIDSTFLKFLFETSFVQEQVHGESSGTTVGTYTITNAKRTVIPFPSLEEQRAIAAVLRSIDVGVQTLSRRLAKMKGIKQGMMQELLTGRARLHVSEAVV